MQAIEDVLHDVRRLFRNSDQALASLGVGPMAAGRGSRKQTLSGDIPLHDRLQMLEMELKGQLHLLADQVEEFEDEVTIERLEAEALAVVIALRELWRHFPEVFPGLLHE